MGYEQKASCQYIHSDEKRLNLGIPILLIQPMSMPIFLTCLDGYAAFKEVIESIEYALKHLGYTVEIHHGMPRADGLNIIFAGHAISLQALHRHGVDPKNVIVYNLEQVGVDVPWMKQHYFELMRHCHVWEYSHHNLAQLGQFGIQNISLVPIGYAPILERLPKVEEDIDIFFYGTMSQRRRDCIQKIRDMGLNIATTEQQQLVGEARDLMIARSKIILNIHYYQNAHIFEIVRASYLLANKKVVVSELGENTAIEDDIKQVICHGNIEQLPQLCAEILLDLPKRTLLAEQGYNAIKQRNIIDYVAKGMDQYQRQLNAPVQVLMPNIELPKKLNIGAKCWKYDFLNMDHRANYRPDCLLNISQELPWNQSLQSWRFGDYQLKKNQFDYILAEFSLSEVDDLKKTMSNCLELLSPDGIFEIIFHHQLSLNACVNPDVKRLFNEESFYFYTYAHNLLELGWSEEIFHMHNIVFRITEYGQTFFKEETGINGIKHIPRALDSVQVFLKKRPLNQFENLIVMSRM